MTIGKRRLGRTGLEVSALGLGCMGMSQSYGTAEERDERESLATIDRALELGVTFFDTAEVYGPFHNEELLGRALRGRRDGVGDRHQVRHRASRTARWSALDSRPEHIREAVEGSLAPARHRSHRSAYQHRVDPAVPIEDVVGAMAELVREGKVRFLGLSEAGEQTIRRAHAVHPIAALQSEYSLWERNLEAEDLAGAARARDRPGALLAARPRIPHRRRRSGPRTTRPSDYRRMRPRFQGENFDANLRAASAVREIAAAKGATPGQIALAWLLRKGDDIVPIPGTKRRQLSRGERRGGGGRLDAAEIARLDAALAPEAIAGPRYNERMMSFIDR